MKPRILTLLLVAIISGCNSSSVVEERSSLGAASLTSSLPLTGGAKAAVETAYSGGATGDTLHHAWICQSDLSRCKQVAVVDTHDGAPPRWEAGAEGLELVIGSHDIVWGFTNFSYLPGPGDPYTSIRLVEKTR
jgi:hypothetical protein